jgi:tetratricopeptide (TPR) repeat protein
MTAGVIVFRCTMPVRRPNARDRRANRWLRSTFVLAMFWLAGAAALAGPVPISSSGGPTAAVEIDAETRNILEINQAIKNFESSKFDLCIEQLGKARQAHPELPPPHALFAKLAFLSGQGALIRPALERAVTEDGGHPEVFILFGNLALSERRLTDAAVHFEKAKALAAEKHWTAEQKSRFNGLSLQGEAVVAEGRGDWKGAKAVLGEWLHLEPKSASGHERLGKALFHLKEYEASYEELLRAAKEDPSIPPPAITMAWLFTRSGKLQKAEEWIGFANKNGAESLAVQMETAAWLMEQGRPDEAQSHVDAAAKLKPGAIEIKRLLGMLARQRKDFAQAEQIFDELAHDAPADAWLRNQLAICLAEQSDPAKRKRAVELAELSVRQDSKSIDGLTTLGVVYYRIKRLEDAEKILQAVASSGRPTSDALYLLAHVREERGHPEAVKDLLKLALDAPGIFVFRKDAQEWFDRLTTESK